MKSRSKVQLTVLFLILCLTFVFVAPPVMTQAADPETAKVSALSSENPPYLYSAADFGASRTRLQAEDVATIISKTASWVRVSVNGDSGYLPLISRPAPTEAPVVEEPAEEPKPVATEKPVVKEEPKPVVTEAPKVEEPKAEVPKVEEPKVEEPKVEEPKVEEPKAEEPKAEEPKAEEPKVEEPKAEEPKAEEPKAEEPKAEEPQVEEPTVEEPVVEENTSIQRMQGNL